MAKTTEVTEFGVWQTQVEQFTQFTKDLRAALKATAESGDQDAALLVRSVLVRLNDKTNVLVSKVHDNFVDFVHSTSGEDFMPKLERIHNPRGRKAGEKAPVDELD